MDDSPITDVQEPEAAFSILADEIRIDILRALWQADETTCSFADLREAVGVRDSGQFNYHLGKLTDAFVRKTDDGYELRSAGRHVVGALLSGTYTMDGTVEELELDDPCPLCGDSLAFSYADDRATVACESCPFGAAFPIPPGAFAGYEPAAFPAVADRYVRTLLSRARNRFCEMCAARVAPALSAEPLEALSDEGDAEIDPQVPGQLVMVTYDCDRCGSTTQINLGTVLLDHPAVVTFHDEHGIDVRAIRLWKLGAGTAIPESTLVEDEPHRATVTYRIEDETLTLFVDDELTVRDTVRREQA
ncbi:winged helix-turn-helix domain-containing protein [Halovivax limisalsi]|uniref:winged helix-turn-helix domain-containing protein n=1 Tax=Halovivax limisalsi TaxID=1453760 RepID=UPI001FFD86E7|nr:helix-turn-helix domain-containing protein [Halovivax limisalsi]